MSVRTAKRKIPYEENNQTVSLKKGCHRHEDDVMGSLCQSFNDLCVPVVKKPRLANKVRHDLATVSTKPSEQCERRLRSAFFDMIHSKRMAKQSAHKGQITKKRLFSSI